MTPIKYNIKYRVIYFIFFIKIIGGFYSMGNKQIIVRFGKEDKNVVARYLPNESAFQLLERAAVGIKCLKYMQNQGILNKGGKTLRKAIYNSFDIRDENENSIDIVKQCEDIIDHMDIGCVKKYFNNIEVFKKNAFYRLENVESLLIDFCPGGIKCAFINTPINKSDYYIGHVKTYFRRLCKSDIDISEKAIDKCRFTISYLKMNERFEANSKEEMPEYKTIVDYISENVKFMTKIEVEQFVNFNYEWETKRLHERMTDSDKHTENNGKCEERKANMNVENNNYIEKKADLKMLKTDSGLYININNIEYMKIRRNLENINLKNIDADVDNDVHIYVKMQSNEHEIEGWEFGSVEDAEEFLESITFIVNAKK
jgi:hypothetical protein